MKRISFLVLAALMFSALFLPACSLGAPKVYKVATDATWPPMEFFDDNGEIVGLDIEMMNAIAEQEGFQVEYINVAWEPLLEGVADCTYDMAVSSMSITPERVLMFNFSDPYFAAGQLVVVKADDTTINGRSDLTGKTIGVQAGTTGEAEARAISGTAVTTYVQVAEAFEALKNSQVDAVITDNTLVYEFVNQSPAEFKYVGDVFTAEMLAIAVCKTDTELLSKINHGLAAIKARGLLDELTAKWFGGQ